MSMVPVKVTPEDLIVGQLVHDDDGVGVDCEAAAIGNEEIVDAGGVEGDRVAVESGAGRKDRVHRQASP